jgi:hypothetical protein
MKNLLRRFGGDSIPETAASSSGKVSPYLWTLAIVPLLLNVAATRASSYIYVPDPYDQIVYVIGSTSKTVVATLTGTYVTITPDGALAYVSNSSPNGPATTIIDTRTNTVVQTLPLVFRPVFSPDGARAYFNAGPIVVMDTATKAFITTVDVPNFFLDPAKVTANGEFLFALGTENGSSNYSKIFVFSTLTNSLVNTIPVGPGSIAFSEDGAVAYQAESTGTDEDLIRVINMATGTEVNSISVPDPQHTGIYGILVSPDQSFLCVIGRTSDLIQNVLFIDTASEAVVGSVTIQPWPAGGPPATLLGVNSMNLTHDGSKIYLAASEFPPLGMFPLSCKIFIIDAASRTVVGTSFLPQPGTGAGAIAIGPDRACGEDFTTQTLVVKSGFSPFIFPQLQVQTIAVVNGRTQSIRGPITLFLNNINNAVFVGNNAMSTCYAPGGGPYTVVSAGPDNIFNPGEIVVIPLLFFKTGAGPITYTHRVVSGSPGQ